MLNEITILYHHVD